MKVANIVANDIVDCDDGVCVSLWVSGCPHRCKGCHNQELWDYDSGTDVDIKALQKLLASLICKNDIYRHFSVLGGEPLCPENIEGICQVVSYIRNKFNDKIKIYLWTGYTIEYLKDASKHPDANYTDCVEKILCNTDILIEGPYIESLRKLNLKLRGSTNQRVIKNPKDFESV